MRASFVAAIGFSSIVHEATDKLAPLARNVDRPFHLTDRACSVNAKSRPERVDG